MVNRRRRRGEAAEQKREDQSDLAAARQDAEGDDKVKQPWWNSLGPGLITGAADDDPSGIGTYSVTGAQFGYTLLWLVPLCTPLMIAVQGMCAKVSLVTGRGLAEVIKEHYGRPLLYISVALLVLANIINIYADLNAMADAMHMVFGLPDAVWLTVLTASLVASIIYVPYVKYVKVLKYLTLSLLAYVIVAFIPGVHLNVRQILLHFFVPSINLEPAMVLATVGFLGTTISPYLFFWQAGEIIEEEIAEGVSDQPGHRKTRVSGIEMRRMYTDTVIGMVVSQAIAFFIVVVTSATLHEKGTTNIETAQDAAKALLPLGHAAYGLFTLGIVSAGLLAIPTLAGSAAYAVSETFGWRYGLYRRFKRAKGFYITIAAMVILAFLLNFVHTISPVKGLLYSAALNGAVAPPLIIVLLLICNNRSIMREKTNGRWTNFFGWLTVVLMGIAAMVLLYMLLTGKVS